VHTSVERIVVEEGRATGVTARDRLDGRAYEFSARAVVNCTGAWSPITAATAGVSEHVRVRPGKGVHLILDRPITDVGVMADAIDGRQIFIEPWGNTALIGTTDDDTYADLDDLPVTTDEVRYLVEGIEQVLPRVRDARIIGDHRGARPSLYAWGKMEDALSREHEVVDHAAHGARASTPSSAASWRATGCSPRRPRTSSPRRWATTPRARRTRRRCRAATGRRTSTCWRPASSCRASPSSAW
jgi:glycerol-3-phosphate dehydrogenase